MRDALRAPSLLLVLALLALTSAAPAPARGATVAEDLARIRGFRGALRWTRAQPWAEAESLATSVLARLEGSREPDSLQMAEALYAVADARDAQRKWDDDVALQSVKRSLEIRMRRLPPNDLAIAESEAMYSGLLLNANADSAVVHARRGLEIRLRQPVPDDTLVASSWVDVGDEEVYRGQPRAGLDALGHAYEIRMRLFGPNDQRLVAVVMGMGDARFQLGELETARDLQEQALAILDRSGVRDDTQRGGVLSQLVQVNWGMGDLARAIDWAEQDLQLATAAGDTTDMIASRNNLAVILQDLNDNEGASRIFASLIPLCERYRGAQQWITCTIKQAYGNSCFATGDTALAMRLFQEAEAGLKVHPHPEGNATLAFCVLGQAQVLQAEKRHREARTVCERGMPINDSATRPDRTTLATSRALWIRILEALHDTTGLDSARTNLAAIRDRHALGSGMNGPVINYWLARADHDVGRGSVAWNEALEADGGIREKLRLNAETLPDVRALELARRRAYILSQVLDLASEAEPSRWETAWDRLVRTRGLVRAEIARRRLPSALKSDTQVVRVHDEWVAAQRQLARRLVRGISASADSDTRAALDTLRSTADRAEAAYARALRARGADTARVDIGLADVRARLTPSQALVAFAEIEGRDQTTRMIAFVARGGAPGVDRIELGGSDSLRAVIDPWRERLASSPGPNAGARSKSELECRRYGARVRAKTWDRIAPHLGGASEVAIVPDGPIADLPWHALPVGSDGYLVERGPLLRVLNAERELAAPPREIPDASMLAMGDPDFELAPGGAEPHELVAMNALRTIVNPCAMSQPLQFPPLPGTRAEVNDVALEWRGNSAKEATVLLGPEATEAAFKQLAPQSAIVHVATHGVVVGDDCRGGESAARAGVGGTGGAGGVGGARDIGGGGGVGGPDGSSGARGVGGVEPLSHDRKHGSHAGTAAAAAARREPSPWMGRRVWLALAAANHARELGPDENDGLLTAEEVATLDLTRTDWVVLSACHSGLAESWAREGTLGMRRAFELAGARSVIASQWAVEDAATADWMRALYSARAQGRARAAEALQAACRRVLTDRRHAGRSTHPFYWAAFTASGE